MNLLALSTSSSQLSVAVKTSGGELFEQRLPGSVNHVENLLPALDQLLKKGGLTLAEMDYYLMDRGPGSFTGLRIGFATLKAFHFLQKKDCFGLLSLDLVAENINAADNSLLWVIMDARRDQWYTRPYKRSGGRWNPLAPCAAQAIHEGALNIPDDAVIAGDAVERYRAFLEKATAGKKLQWADAENAYPRASTLIRLFENKDPKLTQFVSPADFIPLYVRLSEPEEKQKNACLS